MLVRRIVGLEGCRPQDCWPGELLAKRIVSKEDCWPGGLLAWRRLLAIRIVDLEDCWSRGFLARRIVGLEDC